MNTKGNNRSVQRTKKLLKQGLNELMLTKPPKQISVKELTDYVDLNRGTFYLHYRDIFDLLDQMEDEMIEDFQSILNAHQIQDLKGKPYPLLVDLFRLLKENVDFCKALLGENGDPQFIVKLKQILKERCFTEWEQLFPKAKAVVFESFYSFMISGCIGILENWILGDMKQPTEEIAALTEQIILKGIMVLE